CVRDTSGSFEYW
nr:immunoglobulin heavy chain junction region [Macaca mulatta]